MSSLILSEHPDQPEFEKALVDLAEEYQLKTLRRIHTVSFNWITHANTAAKVINIDTSYSSIA